MTNLRSVDGSMRFKQASNFTAPFISDAASGETGIIRYTLVHLGHTYGHAYIKIKAHPF